MEQTSGARRFWVSLAVLAAVLVAVPVLALAFLDIDGRTSLTVAQDALHERYGLDLVDEAGRVVPQDSSRRTVSEFSVQAGATTRDVPFVLDGQPVLCTVRVPDGDPGSVTATCEPDLG